MLVDKEKGDEADMLVLGRFFFFEGSVVVDDGSAAGEAATTGDDWGWRGGGCECHEV